MPEKRHQRRRISHKGETKIGLGSKKGRAVAWVITEVLIIPGTESSRMSALIRLYMLPNMRVAGSAHSHPSGDLRPSEPDIIFFSRTGDYHLIVGPPFDERSWVCYDGAGKRRDLAVLDVDFRDDGFDDVFDDEFDDDSEQGFGDGP
jgi:proteasome lid subunit RPN8/RPN11